MDEVAKATEAYETAKLHKKRALEQFNRAREILDEAWKKELDAMEALNETMRKAGGL